MVLVWFWLLQNPLIKYSSSILLLHQISIFAIFTRFFCGISTRYSICRNLIHRLICVFHRIRLKLQLNFRCIDSKMNLNIFSYSQKETFFLQPADSFPGGYGNAIRQEFGEKFFAQSYRAWGRYSQSQPCIKKSPGNHALHTG